jgi:hypothetical protein
MMEGEISCSQARVNSPTETSSSENLEEEVKSVNQEVRGWQPSLSLGSYSWFI